MLGNLRRILFGPLVRIVVAVVAAWLLFSWLAVGPVVQWAASRFIAAHGERTLTIERARFNPLRLALELEGLDLVERDGTPLLSFDRLLADFELASLVRRAWTFREIALDAPTATVVLRADGSSNWLDFVADLAGDERAPEPRPETGPTPLLVERLTLTRGAVDLSDQFFADDFRTRIEPIDLGVTALSTLPDEQGEHGLRLDVATGGELRWKGRAALNPLDASGEIALSGIVFESLWPYVARHVSMAPPEGTGELGFSYRVAMRDGEPAVVIDGLTAKVSDLELAGHDASEPGVRIDSIALADGRLDLQARQASVGSVEISGGSVVVRRHADGAIDMASWFAPPADRSDARAAVDASRPDDAGDESPWQFELAQAKLDGVAVRYVDEGFAKPLVVAVRGVQAGVAVTGAGGGAATGLRLDELDVKLTGVSLGADDAAKPVLDLASVHLADGKLDLREQSVDIASVRIDGLRGAMARAANGRIPALDALTPVAAARPAPAPEPAGGEGWRYRLGEIALDDGEFTLGDATVKPAARLGLKDIHVALREVSQDLAARWPLEAGFAVREGGRVAASGFVVAGAPSGELSVQVSKLALAPAQPYLAGVARLEIAGGQLGTTGRLRFGEGRFRYDGGIGVAGLDLHEAATGKTLLGWKSLATKTLAASETGIDIGELLLDGLQAKLVIFEDHSVNVAQVLVAQADAPAAADSGKAAADAAPAFAVGIEQLRLADGDVDFADLSLALPFATHVHELEGSLAGLSNAPGSAAAIALKGLVDEYGSAKVDGEIDLFAPARHTDARVEFRNVEMTRLTPYAATFAGRRIDSGKLSLDLGYRIEDGQLEGQNRIVMDQLTLGERVESSSAPDLPLDLAVAILKDRQGRIDLGLPVAGSLEDPEFSIGGLVGKALLGLVTKIVTAPFRALAALLGGDAEVDLSQVAFEPGSAQLAGAEREKLVKLAGALAQRPNLGLELAPAFSPAVDGEALRERALRRELATRLGRTVEPDADPGPVAFGDAGTRRALEALFAERIGQEELDRLRSEALAAGKPGAAQEAQPVAGEPGEARAGEERAEREGSAVTGRFYRQPFEHLRDAERPGPGALAALALARGQAVRQELEAHGLAPARMRILEPAEAGAQAHTGVGLQLDAQGDAGRVSAAAARGSEGAGRAAAPVTED